MLLSACIQLLVSGTVHVNNINDNPMTENCRIVEIISIEENLPTENININTGADLTVLGEFVAGHFVARTIRRKYELIVLNIVTYRFVIGLKIVSSN